MLKRWIVYIGTLVGAVAFYGIYDGYISYFILISAILFPFFSLLISLISMLRVRFSLMPFPLEITKGEDINATMCIDTWCLLPLSQINITYTANNITFSVDSLKIIIIKYGCISADVLLPLNTDHVGCISLNIKKIRVFDYLGLFSISLKAPEKRRVIILPKLVHPVPMPILPIDKVGGKGLKPKPGGGFAEDYDLREYRIGDPLNAIHWKLTSKFDKYIVKEPLISEKGKIFICFNLFGSADELDSVFGQISYIAHIMIRRMIEFSLCWYGKDGKLNVADINEVSDYNRFIVAIFIKPIEATGNAIDVKAYKDSDWHYFVSPNLQLEGEND